MRGVLLIARGAALSRGDCGGNATHPTGEGLANVKVADVSKPESDFAVSCP